MLSGSRVKGMKTPNPRIRRSRRRMTEAQEITVQSILRSSLPSDGSPWTRTKAHALVGATTGIDLPERTFGTYLERWGFNPKKLLRRSYHQDPMAMKTWMVKDYPAIAMVAKATGAEILWLGHEHLPVLRSSDGPIATHEGRPIGAYMLHTTTNRGHIEWEVQNREPVAEDVLGFVDGLLRHHGPIMLITAHGTSLLDDSLQTWRETHAHRLSIHTLPALRRPSVHLY